MHKEPNLNLYNKLLKNVKNLNIYLFSSYDRTECFLMGTVKNIVEIKVRFISSDSANHFFTMQNMKHQNKFQFLTFEDYSYINKI